MDRKRFLWYTVTGAAAMYLPLQGCKHAGVPKALLPPQLLSHFCDGETLRAIGEDYRRLAPAENDTEKLLHLLSANGSKGQSAGGSDEQIVRSLAARIQADFKSGRTLVLKGWVLSQTEARQCALFSLQS